MNNVQVITGWIGDGQSAFTAYRPALSQDHPVPFWTDLTGAKPTPGGTYTIAIQCDNATLAAIEADPKYQGNTTVTHGS